MYQIDEEVFEGAKRKFLFAYKTYLKQIEVIGTVSESTWNNMLEESRQLRALRKVMRKPYRWVKRKRQQPEPALNFEQVMELFRKIEEDLDFES